MKTSNRGILNTLYILTGLWLLVFLLGRVSLAVIAIPPLLIYGYVFPSLSLMASFYYFCTNKKWILERKLAACIFILPFIIVFILPRIMEYEKLIKTEPTYAVITEFIKLETIGAPKRLDLPSTKVNYQNEIKSLDISITINSQAFINDSTYGNSSPEFIAAVIRNVLYNYSVHIPQNISKETLVPQSINFYTYWDDSLLLSTHFSRDKKRYRIIK
ncbi:hypothetical protein [Paenibacillus sp. MMO-58]|uniref:hypothetical protein n=1 Tax=Paenibacillus sp. MMO-58 TaxID=3081290 RepID=UPI00301860C9